MKDFSQIRFIKESSEVFIHSAKDVFNYLKNKTSNLDREYFFVIHLNSKGKIIFIEIAHIGTLNSTIIHPREIFRTAIMNSTNSIILAHNHPSGDPSPSKEDIEITKILKECGDLLDIRVLDLIILGNNFYYSNEEKKIK
jgi:DNA repair protein RadC